MPTANNASTFVVRRARAGAFSLLAAALFSTGLFSAACHGLETPAARREVLGHGTPKLFWVAVNEKVTDKTTMGSAPEQSRILTRQILEKRDWQTLPPLPARVLSVSSQGLEFGAEAIVLLENKPQGAATERLWAWFSAPDVTENEVRSTGRYSYGPALPNRAKILAVGGDRNPKLVWAIGKTTTTTPPATQSLAQATTQPSPATTRPATAPSGTLVGPAAPGVTLFSLEGESWKSWPMTWPAELDDEADLIPMTVINDTPIIALAAGTEIRVYEMSREGRNWRRLHAVKVEPAPHHVKLLNIEGRPALWIQPQPEENRVGDLWTAEKTYRLEFKESGALPSANDLDVTYAGDEIRVVFRRDNKLYEKRYSRLGEESGGPIEIVSTARTGQPPIHWVTTAIMAVFTVLIISTLLRKRAAEKEGGGDRDRDRDRDRDEE